MRLSRGSAHVVLPIAIIVVALVASISGVSAPPLPPPPPGPGDTAVVHGPRRYDAPIGSSNTIQNFVDTIPVTMNPYHRYVIRVKNGNPDGTQRVLRAFVAGTDSITGSIAQKAFEIAVKPTTLITVAIRGQASAGHLTIELLEINGGNFAIFGTERFSRQNSNSDVVFTRTFTRGANAGPPFFLWIINGTASAGQRIAGVIVKLNGDTVVGPAPRFPSLPASTFMLMVKVSPVSGSNALVIILPRKEAGYIDLTILATDNTPPALKIILPQPNLVTRLDSVNIVGTLTDPSPHQVSINGIVPTMTGDTFRLTYPLPHVDGPHLITFTAVDAAGNRVDSTRTVRVDRTPPTVTVTAPPNGFITNQSTIGISYTGSDVSAISFYLNGQPANGCGGGTCSFTIFPPLVEGPNSFGLMAVDAAGNTSTTQMLLVTRDTQRPTLTVSAPADGATVSTPTVTVQGTASDAMLKDVTVNGVATTVTNGAFSKDVSLTVGQNTIVVIATDSATNADTVTRTVTQTGGLPPDPVTVATAIDPTVPTNFATSTAFLYTGSNPIQTGVAAGTIEAVRAAVVKGRVLDRAGQPLSGVRVTAHADSELGQTLSRADGAFDFAVNGGGPIVLDFDKPGYLPAQRGIDVPWQQFRTLNDVSLVTLDAQVSTIDFTQPVEVARGSPVTDERGHRQATMFFYQGTQATMVLPGGGTQPLDTLHVRATEYTIGLNGPRAMPAALPPTSAYTYAVELSADEAIAAGATAVQFSHPITLFIENYLGLPVGTAVPVGAFDRALGAWRPSDDGRVLAIVDTVGGLATVDLTGDGIAESGSVLDAAGITVDERRQLARLYGPGQQLWRVQLAHFTVVDCNMPIRFPPDAKGPPRRRPRIPRKQDKSCHRAGNSSISCENQELGEAVGLIGADATLHYQSAWAHGDTRARSIEVELTDDTINASLKRIELQVTIAGTTIRRQYAPAANLRDTIVWDDKDAYGRAVQGSQPVEVRIGYVYPYDYVASRTIARTFGLSCAPSSPSDTLCVVLNAGNGAVQEDTLWGTYSLNLNSDLSLGQLAPALSDLGGWRLSVHHAYDPHAKILSRGDGERESALSINRMIKTIAGTGSRAYNGDGIPALSANFDAVGIALGPDGAVYVADEDNRRVRRIGPDGIITTVAGNGSYAASGDGGSALNAGMDPIAVVLGPDGSQYIADYGNHRVRRVDTTGTISTIAGNGTCDNTGDGGPATIATLCFPQSLAIGLDGSLYILSGGASVRRVDPGGFIATVAGDGNSCNEFLNPSCGDGGPAVQAEFASPQDIALGPDGSLYIADDFMGKVRRVTPDGIINPVAGNGAFSGGPGDGGPALQARLRDVSAIAISRDGVLYIVDRARIREVDQTGIITTVVGNGDQCFGGTDACGDGGAATQATLRRLEHVALGPNGTLYVSDLFGARIRQVAAALPGFTNHDFLVASSSRNELYAFDSTGRHLRTIDPLTAVIVRTFSYDSMGRLAAVQDRDGNRISIARGGDALPVSITAPFGRRTMVASDPTTRLSTIVDPADDSTRLGYDSTGLLRSLQDPRNNLHSYSYGSTGALQADTAPDGLIRTVAQTANDTVSETTITTALGRRDVYRVEQFSTGVSRRTHISRDGLTTQTTVQPDATGMTTLPSGSTVSFSMHADPRFGMQHSILGSMTISTPGGLQSVAVNTRHVTLADPNNPLSLLVQTDSVRTNGRTYTNIYDAAERSFTTVSPSGRRLLSRRNAKGRLEATFAPGVDSVIRTYDSFGRLSTIRQGGRVWSYGYDGAGRLSLITDPVARTEAFAYDSASRVTSRTMTGGRTVTYSHDRAGHVTSITPPSRPPYTFIYTAGGLLSDYTAPQVGDEPSTTHYTYNADRQLFTVTRPDSSITTFVYDSVGRLRTLALPQGALQYHYGSSTGVLDSIVGPSGSLKYTHDADLVTRVNWTGPITGSLQMSYDNDFRVSSAAVNGGPPTINLFDPDGLLIGAGDLQIARDTATGFVTGTTVGSVPSGHRYDSFGARASDSALFGSALLYQHTYDRDSLGRIKQLHETIQGQNSVYDYDYDRAGRIKEVKLNGVSISAYDYDSAGNRIRLTSQAGVIDGSYDVRDRLLSYGTTTYSYNANGELRTKVVGTDTTRYTFDDRGNLAAVRLAGGTVVDYVLDGLGRRIGKKVNGQLTQGFLYEGLIEPIAELDGLNQIVSLFVYGTRPNVPDYMVRNGVEYRLISDHNGSVRLVVNTQTGEVAQRIDYDEFGRVLLNTNPGFQPFGFAGGLYDNHSRLTHFGARDYDALTGRWISSDPVHFRGGDVNLYRYAAGDPINIVDWTGLWPSWGQVLNAAAQISAGFGDFITSGFGLGELLGLPSLTELARRALDANDVVDPCSGLYELGKIAGMVVGALLASELEAAEAGEGAELAEGGEAGGAPGAGPRGEYEWRGNGPPGSSEGSWYNPETGEYVHPDLQHPEPIGPHYDYRDPEGNMWRINPETGESTPKP